MELVLPMHYVELEKEEMMYLDGGWFSISKGVFKAGCNVAAIAALTIFSGGIALAGLKTVLASYSLRSALAATIVKTAGILCINVGNGLSSKLIAALAGAAFGDVFGWVFDNYIDRLDGKFDGYIKIF